MKYVYLVHERNKLTTNNTEFCGIAYYTSYKKALEDFNNRVDSHKDYELIDSFDDNGNLTTHIREYKINNMLRYEVQLLKHEVY